MKILIYSYQILIRDSYAFGRCQSVPLKIGIKLSKYEFACKSLSSNTNEFGRPIKT